MSDKTSSDVKENLRGSMFAVSHLVQAERRFFLKLLKIDLILKEQKPINYAVL